MKIRTSLPWTLKIVLTVLGFGLAGAMAMWAYDMGRNITGFNPATAKQQMIELKDQIEKLTAERDDLSTVANAAESKLNIERSAQKQLVAQAKTLELENIKLKEDLAFFESLLPTGAGPGAIAIRSLKVGLVGPNQLRFQLLVMQGGKGTREFSGSLQLVISVLQQGKNVMIVVPGNGFTDVDKFKLGFKHYQRVDNILTLPEGVSVKAVQARVLEKGQMRAQQSANL